jgi:D-arginine dehydrogenase
MRTDFCVIGGGIAGLSVAYELCDAASVVVLEREPDLAYHTTGRSAALYTAITVSSTALALSRLSLPFFLAPPVGFSDYPLRHGVECLYVATSEEMAAMEHHARRSDALRLLGVDDMLARVPVLRTGDDCIVGGLLEPDAFKIDVGALVGGYRKGVRARGGEIRCNAEVVTISAATGGWRIRTADGETIAARKLVNAAGAWGDVIASLAAVAPVGLTPLRRTMIVFDAPDDADPAAWTPVGGIQGGFYFLPESGRLMGSAADETPSPPCDAQPEEFDVAVAAHNIESKTTLTVDRIRRKWAGLRTFSPDRQLVAGYDDGNPDFFWFVGQGGFGIQTAPAASRAAARLALGRHLPDEYDAAGVTASALARQRLGEPGRQAVGRPS